MTDDIKFLTHKLTIYYDKKRKKELHLKNNNKIYLFRKNIKI